MRSLSSLCVALGVLLPVAAFWALFTHDSFGVDVNGNPQFIDRTPEVVAAFAAPVMSVALFVLAGRLSRRH